MSVELTSVKVVPYAVEGRTLQDRRSYYYLVGKTILKASLADLPSSIIALKPGR